MLAVLIFFFCNPCFQIRKNETPIIKYNRVHTGPKSQFGGAKKGLFRVTYQVGMAEIVKGVPRSPTNSHPTTETKSFGKFFMLVTVCAKITKRAINSKLFAIITPCQCRGMLKNTTRLIFSIV